MAKRSLGKFNSVPSDQCIEQTVNRQQKCKGGITGFASNESTVQRWVLSSHTVSQCKSNMEEMLRIKENPRKTKDIGKSRIEFDSGCCQRAFDIMKNWGNPFEIRDSLINVSSGIEAPEPVKKDLIEAHDIGESAFNEFLRDRIQSNNKSFYDPIKRCSLKTFKSLTIKKTVSTNGKSIVIAAERNIFARLLAIAKSRESLSLKDILVYSLGPIPYSLGTSDGGLVKTAKSKLLSK